MNRISNLLFTAALLVLSATAARADSIQCGHNYNDRTSAFGIDDKMTGRCDNAYSFEIKGFGLAARAVSASGLIIDCPGVGNMKGKYYGVNVVAAVIVGAQLAVFASRDGVCLVGGINGMSLGASISGARLTIE